MDPWRLSQHLVFPLIQTLSGKCFATIFPLVGLARSLVSCDELVAAFPGRAEDETNGATRSCVFVLRDCACR